jgi:recombination protein RecA
MELNQLLDKHKQIIMKGTEVPIIKPARTNILGLDMALGGGIPRGGVTILAGKENSLKTTIALRAAKNYLPIIYIDADRSFNKTWFTRLGVDMNQTFVAYPQSMEDCYNLLDKEVMNPEWGSIIVDSLGLLSPTKELASNSEDDNAMGLRARQTNEVIRRVCSRLSPTSSVMIILINHLYSTISSYGHSPDAMPCGRGQRFLSKVILNLRKTEKIPKESGKPLQGVKIQWKVEKSKVGPEGKVGSFTFWVQPGERDGVDFESGDIDYIEQYTQYLSDEGIIERSGPYYDYKITGERFQGMNSLRQYLIDKEEEIYNFVFTKKYENEDELKRRNMEYMENLLEDRQPKIKGRPKKKSSLNLGVLNSLGFNFSGIGKQQPEDQSKDVSAQEDQDDATDNNEVENIRDEEDDF